MDGTPFGHYQLLELLGRGGMGEVFRAYDTTTDRIVALKVLPPYLAQDNVFNARFRREAQTAARLTDPHIVPIHRYGEIDGRLYLDMRIISGTDLARLLVDARGPLAPSRAVALIRQAAAALHALHQAGLVHRDVKPSNILVTPDDFVYVIDLGIARGVDQTALTSSGGAVGTFAYMAPERLTGGEAGPRADIYALACVFYECLTGSHPFPGSSLEQQITSHLVVDPALPSSVNPALSPAFDDVIAKGLSKDPDGTNVGRSTKITSPR